jgi:hypothetical protein
LCSTSYSGKDSLIGVAKSSGNSAVCASFVGFTSTGLVNVLTTSSGLFSIIASFICVGLTISAFTAVSTLGLPKLLGLTNSSPIFVAIGAEDSTAFL